MPTTIAPSVGTTPSFLQAGPGASPGFGAIDFRRVLFGAPVQEGVIDAGAYEVTQRAAGANLSVDVAASTGNGALVQGDSVAAQGLYYVAPHSAVINEAIAAADATNPRIDSVVLEVGDDVHAAGGINLARVRVITGTATAGATLDNRSGAAALPSTAVRLADVLVPAGDTTIDNTQIRDRRPWARGAHWNYVRTATNITTTSTTYTAADSTNWNRRLECSGVPLEITFAAVHGLSVAGLVLFSPSIDGAAATLDRDTYLPSGSGTYSGAKRWVYVPSAGSHTFALHWKVSTGTGTIYAASQPFFSVREIVSQQQYNNATTSG